MVRAALDGKDATLFGKGDGDQFEEFIFGHFGELLAKGQLKLQG